MKLKRLFKNSLSLRLGGSFLNAIFMIWLTFFFLSLPYVLPDEYMLVRYSSVARNLVLDLQEEPDSSRFLFVNVAWDKVMQPKPDPDFPEHIIGEEPITDRSKLIGLLHLLKENPNYEFVVFDIFFKGETEHDSTLTALINSIPRVLVSYHRDQFDKPSFPDLAIKPLGLSDIEKSYDTSLKFKLFYNDSLKTTPLLMYEQIHKKKFTSSKFGQYIANRPVLNSFILDYRIRNYHYQTQKYPRVHLGEWLDLAYPSFEDMDFDSIFEEFESAEAEGEEAVLEEETVDWEEESFPAEDSIDIDWEEESFPEEDSLDWEEEVDMEGLEEFSEDDIPQDFFTEETDSSFVEEGSTEYPTPRYNPSNWETGFIEGFVTPLTKDRIIFVGDFEDTDIHETIYGNTPGPIILLDAFLALEAGDNVIHWPFLLFLFLSFFLISYITFSYRSIYGAWLQKLTQRSKATVLEALTIYLVYFSMVSVCSFFLFNIHIGVLALAFYMYLIEQVKTRFFYKKKPD